MSASCSVVLSRRAIVRKLVIALAAMSSVAASGGFYSAWAAGGGQGASVTGGGRYDTSECAANFALSGQAGPQGAHGTMNTIFSNAPGAIPGCPGQGQVVAKVTCVVSNGPDAEVRGVITKQTGSLGSDFFPPGNTVYVTDVQDNGNPSSGTPDTIVQYVAPTGTEQDCQAPSGDQLFAVDQGNVTVR
jgi:hypothetical protein